MGKLERFKLYELLVLFRHYFSMFHSEGKPRVVEDKYLNKKIHQFAQDRGYSELEMQVVVSEHGTQLEASDFIGKLFMNRNNRPLNCEEASQIYRDTAVITTGTYTMHLDNIISPILI